MFVYKITNIISNSVYIGITKTTVQKRFNSHKYAANRGKKTKFYDAIRSYGIHNFVVETIDTFSNWEDLARAELQYIKSFKEQGFNLYNLKDELQPHFYIKDKEAHKQKLREKRKGRTPAKGMKHTEENKELFKLVSNKYWDTQEKYDFEIIRNYGFAEANRRFKISKTHYYRLRKQWAARNESSLT